jgi:hypothetical protein
MPLHVLSAAVGILIAAGSGFAAEGASGRQASTRSPREPSEAEKQFNQLYCRYSSQFHERMVAEAERLSQAEIAAEASRIWDEVFGPHKDLLRKRSEELLAALTAAARVDEGLYYEVMCCNRCDGGDCGEGAVPKQVAWNPVATAALALDRLLARVMQPNSYAVRSTLVSHAVLTWEAVDRSLDRQRLLQRQGPLIFIVELARKDEGYRAERIRWLRPKCMRPATVQQGPPAAPAEAQKAAPKPDEKAAKKAVDEPPKDKPSNPVRSSAAVAGGETPSFF